ncbi:DUF4160 domain-containing protein [Gallibacterium anatis]|uniref:DUF4160 domain-containing protein n=2 Tax=Gallibacterium TaxID=155493 RepID=F4HBM6_GALAU|nr:MULTISPECIES: DUF4160 domain-containing protein [Gallibacterium]AEC16383.1 hypothetical protein UMN179_00346 [Gallibacterium anatis UMN179]KGQ32324.1 hypothetical protein P375_05885 [Gallibacterium genomosp. 2]KGQ32714.1 hypothetical protein JP34_09090 [Gallibacterium anatis]KGQ36395.1 hypothetical protein JP35_10475 [Gallibacterium anatis]KGQ36708.1 hypothetical protein JP30_11575 [Gallibacterium anatis IPDH697-78]
MPVILRFKGYKLFFYSNEGNPLEPPHIHVRKAGNEAKFWLEPVSLAQNDGFNAKELKELLIYISTQKEIIQGHWYEYFS